LSILEEAGRLPRPEGIDASTNREQRALVFQHIGRIHSGLAHLDDAVTAYRRAVEIAPGASDGRVKLGRAYFTGNRLDEAQSEFERAARAAPDNKEAHLGLSGVYLARSQWRLAATAAERAVKLDPSNSRGLYLLGTALLRMGRHEEGQARLREFAKVESNAREVERRYVEIDAISLGAIRALREGNGNGAIQQLMQGIASHPASSRLHMNLAMILSRVGQHQGAVEILESMLKRTNDGRLLIHKHLAGEYKVLGDLEASRHHRQIYLDTRGVEFIASASPLN
jgi:tetratricopeptide (TPR) repeat protein